MTGDPRDDAVFVPSPDVVARRIAGEYLLVPVRSGVAAMDFIFTANEVGSVVFRLLDGRRSIRDIARLISAEFEVTEPVAASEVLAFLETLRGAGLVRPAEETRP